MNVNTSMSIVGILDGLSLTIEGLREIGKIIFAMAKIIGVIKPEVNIEEIGDKAIQAEMDGIVPEKYDNYSDYLSEIEKYVVDPERSQKISQDSKELKGIEIAISLIVEKFVNMPVLDFIKEICANPENFDNGIIEAYSEIINQDPSFISDYVRYVNGTEKNAEIIKRISGTLVNVEKNVHPEISEKDAYKYVMQLRK